MSGRRRAAVAGGLLIAAVLPVVVAAVRAARGWYPLGDNALYGLRARDVLTEHHPWIGTWSSASLSSGVDVNHPGPLLVDLLAVPARIDPIRGVPVGIALLHIAVIATIAWTAHRRGGLPAVAIVLAAATTLVWSLGSELIVDPWQPNAMLLPFLLLLVLAWGLACGDLVLLPLAVAVGSLLVQTHLSYVVVVPGLLLVSLVLGLRGASAPVTRWLAVAALVGAVLWVQPVVEQLTSTGQGNLARLASTRGGDDERAGPRLAVRLVAGVEVIPPAWLRPSYGETYAVPIPGPEPTAAEAGASGLPSAVAAIAALAGLAAALAAGGWMAARRHDGPVGRAAVMAVVTGATALGLLLVSAAIQPFNPVLGLGGHQVAWLWPLGAFLWASLGMAVGGHRRAGLLVGAVVTVVVSLAALPARDGRVGPRLYDEAAPTMEALGTQLATLDGGPYLLDFGNLYFGDPYSTATALELVRHGVEVEVAEEGLVRQLGEERRFDGDAAGRLYLEIGERAIAPPPSGHRRVAFARGLRPSEARELAQAKDKVLDGLAGAPVPLNEAGRAALARGDLPVLDDPQPDPAERLVSSRELVRIARSGLLDPSAELTDVIVRWAELQHRDDTLTAAVLVGPLSEPIPGDR